MGVKFINTDLNLRDTAPVLQLVTELEKHDVFALGEPKEMAGVWSVAMEVGDVQVTMQNTVEKILRAIENLDPHGRELWNRCRTREIDIGFEGDKTGRETSVGLEPDVLRRISETGATLKFTVYRC